jgi:hypothetical protein
MSLLDGSARAVNLSDVENARIGAAAVRLANLLADRRVLGNPPACACLDDLLGAVHALYLARLHGFEDRPSKPIEVPVLEARAKDLSAGRVRIDGKWAAGFYFNGALFRMAAVYHRLLKVILDKPESREYVGDLRKQAASQYQRWTEAEWESLKVVAIHDEVNTLKHTASGVYASRHTTFDDAVGSLTELLELADQWLARKAPPAPAPAA